MIETVIAVTTPMRQAQVAALVNEARTVLCRLSGRPAHMARSLRVSYGPSRVRPGCRRWEVCRGQGLGGYLRVTHGPDPLPDRALPAGTYVEVYLESAGHGRGDRRDLHAAFVREMTSWLTRVGASWRWRCEDSPWQSTAAHAERVISRAA